VDWDFGLTDRNRTPKPALATLRHAYAEVPFPDDLDWPRISIVLCSYNGARVIRDCLEGIRELDYPCFETIVVDDGSTDATAAIAREMRFRVISTPNQGLSAARNTGMEAATGEIIAYIDDDARPDPHWLTYLAATFMRTPHVGVGGPNIPPPGDGLVADCVANAPGGPIHVLLSDQIAEHIPGCNSAFRKSALHAVGGFDPRFRTAGDDVDVCWKLQERGWSLGFNPAAMVWHHRRSSVWTYWKQQVGYGRAEALLERRWPEKYNGAGHPSWGGRIYGDGLPWFTRGRGRRIYHGTWGTAPFQPSYEQSPSLIACLVAMPEWYLVLAFLAGLSVLGLAWTPLLMAAPVLLVGSLGLVVQASLSAREAMSREPPHSHRAGLNRGVLTAILHLVQPLARLVGRYRAGLTPWRYGRLELVMPRIYTPTVWSEHWRPVAAWVKAMERELTRQPVRVGRGGAFDRWDLEVATNLFGAARVLTAVEEHGAGRQLIRFRIAPRWSAVVLTSCAGLVGLGIFAGIGGAWGAASVLSAVAVLAAGKSVQASASAVGHALGAVEGLRAASMSGVDPDHGVPPTSSARTGCPHVGEEAGPLSSSVPSLAFEEQLRPRRREP
jgi:GT2 family glycosyltransferase